MRVRGLKPTDFPVGRWGERVAPHAGAWIETNGNLIPWGSDIASHPMRVRGLKHYQ